MKALCFDDRVLTGLLIMNFVLFNLLNGLKIRNFLLANCMPVKSVLLNKPAIRSVVSFPIIIGNCWIRALLVFNCIFIFYISCLLFTTGG